MEEILTSLSKTEQQLLLLLKRGLFGTEDSIDGECDWKEVFTQAREHTVFPIAYDGSLGLDCPQDKQEKLRAVALLTLTRAEALLSAQDEILSVLATENIFPVVLKGASAAVCYKKPLLRAQGDIDLLFYESELQKAAQTLENNGFTRSTDENDHHISFGKIVSGIEIEAELHKTIGGIPKNAVGDDITRFLQKSIDGKTSAKIGTHEFFVLPTKAQAVTLLIHAYAHAAGTGLGLRQVCDWAAFLDNSSTDKLMDTLQGFGLAEFCKTLTFICVSCLGLASDKALYEGADEKVCLELLSDILKSGNFGRSEGANRHTGDLAEGKHGTAVNVVINFFKISKKSWRAANSFPPLLVLAPIYIPLRHFYRVVSGKRPKVNTAKAIKDAERRKRLFESLDMFKPKKEGL